MTLKEFMIVETIRLTKFYELWEKHNKEIPEYWPLEMSQADWEEQYMCTFEMGDDNEPMEYN